MMLVSIENSQMIPLTQSIDCSILNYWTILQKHQDRESLEEGAEGGWGGVFESSWMGSDNFVDHWLLTSSATIWCLLLVAP
jgi:hypothetical protein